MTTVHSAILETVIKQVKNVGGFSFGAGSLDELTTCVNARRTQSSETGGFNYAVYIVDDCFSSRPEVLARLGVKPGDRVEFLSTKEEPTTEGIDDLVQSLVSEGFSTPAVIIGMGGGSTLDSAKAVSNLLTNGGGKAESYQGWDLVRVLGVHKIACAHDFWDWG